LIVERRSARLEHAAGKLRALAPQATLERGYAIARAGDRILRDSNGLEPDTRVEVELAEGGFGARVEEVRP
jgi:exodeoxyribonuclease VII large subunit